MNSTISFLKYYENAEDLNGRGDFRNKQLGGNPRENRDGRDTGSRRERSNYPQRDTGYTRLFINLGTKDGFYKANFLQFLLDESSLNKEVLGKVDMREMNSWVEVDKVSAAKMIKSIDGKKTQRSPGKNE